MKETMQFSLQHATSAPWRMYSASMPCRLILCTLCSLSLVLAMSLGNPLQAQKPPHETKRSPVKSGQLAKKGQALFTQSCSPCHGANAQGGEGPSLHGLKLSEALIITTVKNGVNGEMPAFGKKYKDGDLKALAAYLRSLNK